MPATTPAALSERFADAIHRGDVAAAMEMWVEDAAILAADGHAVRGREAIGAALTALVQSGARLEVDLQRVLVAGDVALGMGTLTMRGEDGDGRPFEQRSSSAVIYCRDGNGGWRLAIDAPWGLPSTPADSLLA